MTNRMKRSGFELKKWVKFDFKPFKIVQTVWIVEKNQILEFETWSNPKTS